MNLLLVITDEIPRRYYSLVKHVNNVTDANVKGLQGFAYTAGSESKIYLLLPANDVRGKVMFSQVFVCPQGGWLPSIHHWSHDKGVCIQVGLHPGGGQTPPPWILWDMVNERAVCTLLECILDVI